jgi:flagellar hook-length control protein FliK
MALGEALIRIIPLSSSDQGGRAEMVVEPPSMGRVEVELSVQDGAVTANIRVENRELLGIVQAQSQRLRESLEAQGLQVMGLSVDLRNDENRPRGGGDQRRGRSRLNPGSDQEASLFRVDLREGLLHWLA